MYVGSKLYFLCISFLNMILHEECSPSFTLLLSAMPFDDIKISYTLIIITWPWLTFISELSYMIITNNVNS